MSSRNESHNSHHYEHNHDHGVCRYCHDESVEVEEASCKINCEGNTSSLKIKNFCDLEEGQTIGLSVAVRTDDNFIHVSLIPDNATDPLKQEGKNKWYGGMCDDEYLAWLKESQRLELTSSNDSVKIEHEEGTNAFDLSVDMPVGQELEFVSEDNTVSIVPDGNTFDFSVVDEDSYLADLLVPDIIVLAKSRRDITDADKDTDAFPVENITADKFVGKRATDNVAILKIKARAGLGRAVTVPDSLVDSRIVCRTHAHGAHGISRFAHAAATTGGSDGVNNQQQTSLIFPVPFKADGSIDIQTEIHVFTGNIDGYIEGNQSEVKYEVVIIGYGYRAFL